MKYSRFEELPVWQAGMVLAERIFTVTADKAFASQGDLANQLQRAGLSVCNNVAEGFERGSTAELLAFLPIPHLLVQVALTFDRAVLKLAGPGAKLARCGFGKAFEI